MYARPSSRGAFSLQRAPPSRARPASLCFAGGFALFPPSRRGLLPTGTTSGTSSAGGRPRLVYRGLPKHPWCHHSRRVPRRFGFQAGVFQHAWASAPGSHPPNPPVSPGGLRCKRSLHCKPRHKKKACAWLPVPPSTRALRCTPFSFVLRPHFKPRPATRCAVAPARWVCGSRSPVLATLRRANFHTPRHTRGAFFFRRRFPLL
jgi:hypothetical protein